MLRKYLVLSFLILLVLKLQQALAQSAATANTVTGSTAAATSAASSAGSTAAASSAGSTPAATGQTTAAGSSAGTTGASSAMSSGASTSTSAATTTTTVVTTTSNGHLDPTINQICPQNSGVNDKIRRKASRAHNFRRSELAFGRVTKRNGHPMPRASNMIKLKYDCNLETIATNRAQSCSTAEVSAENMYRVPVSSVRDRVEAMEKAVTEWWKQVRKDTPIGNAVTFRAHHQFLPIRSFTRMAWANTRRIGCAVKRCREFWHVVCRYDPAGNVVDQQIYIRGKPCSQCPSGTQCKSELGMCIV